MKGFLNQLRVLGIFSVRNVISSSNFHKLKIAMHLYTWCILLVSEFVLNAPSPIICKSIKDKALKLYTNCNTTQDEFSVKSKEQPFSIDYNKRPHVPVILDKKKQNLFSFSFAIFDLKKKSYIPIYKNMVIWYFYKIRWTQISLNSSLYNTK